MPDKIYRSLSVLTVYPNPFSSTINVNVFSGEKGQCTIVFSNVLGGIEKTIDFEALEGENSFIFDFDENIPIGMYFITVKMPNNERLSEKIVHVKE